MRTPEIPRTVVSLFDVGHWWKTADGRWVTVDQMAPEHRYNTLRMLDRKAVAYQLGYLVCELSLFMQFGAPDDDHPMGDGLSAAEWMPRTALYRALQAGLPTRGKALRRLAERASHWNNCPMRLRRKERPFDASCSCAPATQPQPHEETPHVQ